MNAIRPLALALMLPLAACGSSPKTEFFTLDPVTAQSVSRAGAGPPMQVAAVHIPPVLDRREMVRQSGQNTLVVSDRNRWGAPFDEMVRRVLTQDLAERLPAGRVIFPDEPPPPNTQRVVVDILQFADDGSGQVVFEGSWSVLPSGSSAPLRERHERFSERASADDYGSQVRAMSTILGRLADQIAAGAK